MLESSTLTLPRIKEIIQSAKMASSVTSPSKDLLTCEDFLAFIQLLNDLVLYDYQKDAAAQQEQAQAPTTISDEDTTAGSEEQKQVYDILRDQVE